ncbi:hypothetical protein ACFQU7_21160 [Pseudoroseomonas wenyumeiae]
MAQLPTRPASAAVAAFLDKAATVPALRPAVHRPGRLIFAVDATASRQPGWDMACHLQTEMFQAAAAHGGLEVSLAYYRGFGEFAATPSWPTAPRWRSGWRACSASAARRRSARCWTMRCGRRRGAAACPGLCRRCGGGAARPALPSGRPTRPARHPDLRVPGRA